MRHAAYGWLTETRKVVFLPRASAEHMVIASAAAVPSSSSDELDSCMPVRSVTIVWKFSSDSSLRGAAGLAPFRKSVWRLNQLQAWSMPPALASFAGKHHL